MDNKQNDKTEIAKKIADSTNKISSNFSIMEEYFIRFFRFLSSLIDNFMFSPKYLGIASLLLALIFYFLLGLQDNNLTKALSSSKTLNSVIGTVLDGDVIVTFALTVLGTISASTC